MRHYGRPDLMITHTIMTQHSCQAKREKAFKAAKSDPIVFITQLSKPVIIDEIQRVPELFLAIKIDVDKHRTPGNYLEAQESTLWDVTTGKPIYTFQGQCMLFSPDETLLIVKARNDSTRIEELRALNTATGKILATFESGHPSFSSNGKRLIIKTYKGCDTVWHINF